jgi:alanyl-tRNA synthetase
VTEKQAEELAAAAKLLDGDDTSAKLLVSRVGADTQDDLLQLASSTLRRLGSGVVVMGSVIDDKPQFAAAVSPDLESQGFNAREIAQMVGRAVGGGAGGKASFAQGGGRDSAALARGLSDAEEFVRSGRGS